MEQMWWPGLSAAQKADLWHRWKQGQSLSEIDRTLRHQAAQHRAMHAQILRGLRHCHPAFLNQLHRLQLKPSRKPASLHDPSPVSFIHLTRSL